MNDDGLLSLFGGDIKGYVVNPVTDSSIPRKDLMNFYISLCMKISKGAHDARTIEFLGIVIRLLEVPRDIHNEIIHEMRHTTLPMDHIEVRSYVVDEVKRISEYNRSIGVHPPSPEKLIPEEKPPVERKISSGGGTSDILELESGSLTEQMEKDSVGEMGFGSTFSNDYVINESHSIFDGPRRPSDKRTK
ncbi:MAG: hypothetical protein ACMUIE_01895 [Thermoplasmatota archaeon]